MIKIVAYLLLTTILSMGLLLLYRSILTKENWTPIESKVYKQKIEIIPGSRGSVSYAWVFDIDKAPARIGINMGGSRPALASKIFSAIDTTKLYKFYLDPTVSAANGVQLGIRRIEYGGKPIYEGTNTFNIAGGFILTLISVVGLVIIYTFGRRRNVR